LPVGDDAFSLFVEAAFPQTNLPLSMLRRFPAKTGCGIGFTDKDGENCLAIYPAANDCLTAADVRSTSQSLDGAELVLAQFEIGDEPILEAFRVARANGARTLLNPSPFRTLDPRLLEQTSILVLNRVEALQLARGLDRGVASNTPEDLAQWQSLLREIFRHGPDLILVTLGAQGVTAYQRDQPPLHQHAFDVDVVDTLGAGDSFTAGFAVSTLEHRSLGDCLTRAAACGAIAVRRHGVFDALPTRDELESFLLKAGL
jgi:ribokinase